MDLHTREGGCLCGAVRYRVDGPPLSNSTCHCISCRRASGAPSVAYFKVQRACFALLQGEVREYRSSADVLRGFCARCGTTLTYVHEQDPREIQVTTATLDDPDAWPPTHEVWLAQKILWAPTDTRLPRFGFGEPEPATA
jgi:hypothetical protein